MRFLKGKYCNVAAWPVNKGLGTLQMSVAKLNPQSAQHIATEFTALDRLERLKLVKTFRAE